jgi:hypothetical protein
MSARLQDAGNAITVCDSEADVCDYLPYLIGHGRRFVVRAVQDRCLSTGNGHLFEVMLMQDVVGKRTVSIPQRRGRANALQVGDRLNESSDITNLARYQAHGRCGLACSLARSTKLQELAEGWKPAKQWLQSPIKSQAFRRWRFSTGWLCFGAGSLFSRAVRKSCYQAGPPPRVEIGATFAQIGRTIEHRLCCTASPHVSLLNIGGRPGTLHFGMPMHPRAHLS